MQRLGRLALSLLLSVAMLCPAIAQTLPNPALLVTPGGGSNTPQLLSTVLGRTVNVVDKGAKMDCSTDDTQAWVKAFAAVAQAGGGEVDEPAGCSVVDAVTITGASGAIVVHGMGAGVSMIKPKTLTSTPFTTTGNYISIDGIGFVSASQQTGGSFVHIGAGSTVSLTRFVMLGGFTPVVIDNNTDTIFVDHGRFLNTAAGSSTIIVNGGNDQYLSQLVSDNNPAAQPANGILIANSGATWIDSVDFIHSGNGLAFQAPVGSGNNLTWMFVENSAFDTGSGCGVLVSMPAGTSIRGINFTNTWTSTNLVGVCLQGVSTIDGVSFVNHRAFNNQHQGMLWSQGTNISLDGGSQVSGNSTATPGMYAGVEVGVGISGWSIRNSRIGQEASFGNTQYNSISIDTGGSDNFAIQNNDLRGFTNQALVDLSTGTHKQIGGNLPAPAPQTISLTVSPANATAPQNGTYYLVGGTIGGVSLVHQGVTVPLAAAAQGVRVTGGDVLSVNFSAAPNLYFVGD